MRAVALAVVLAACGGGDVDLTGVYRVESAVASSPCGDDRPVTDRPAYLKFARGNLLGNPFFSYLECADAAATDCVAAGGLLEGFFEPRDDGWVGYSSYASGTDDDCMLRIEEKSATLGGETLVLEEHVHREDHAVVPAGGCTPLEAEARGTAMPCVDHGRMIATRL